MMVSTLGSLLRDVGIQATVTLTYEDGQPGIVYAVDERSDDPPYTLSARIELRDGTYHPYANGRYLGPLHGFETIGDAREEVEAACGEIRMARYNTADVTNDKPDRAASAVDEEACPVSTDAPGT